MQYISFIVIIFPLQGSSWLGPLVTGAITNSTHNARSGFWFLVFSLMIPFVIFLTLDVKKGKDEAVDFAEREKGKKDAV